MARAAPTPPRDRTGTAVGDGVSEGPALILEGLEDVGGVDISTGPESTSQKDSTPTSGPRARK